MIYDVVFSQHQSYYQQVRKSMMKNQLIALLIMSFFVVQYWSDNFAKKGKNTDEIDNDLL